MITIRFSESESREFTVNGMKSPRMECQGDGGGDITY